MTVSGLRALVVLAVGVLALPSSADADLVSVRVHNSAEFAAAVSALRDTGGTIRLRRNDYGGELVVRSRSARPLRIVGERGVRVESLLLEGTQNVSISRLTITPIVDGRVVAYPWVTARCGRGRPRDGQGDAVPGDRAGSRFEPRRHPPKRVPPLRRSLASVLELPARPAGGRGTSRSSTTGSTTAAAATSSTVASATT